MRFRDFKTALKLFGFTLDRIRGSHHFYKRKDIPQAISIQNFKGMGKPYQIEQFIKLVDEYNLLELE